MANECQSQPGACADIVANVESRPEDSSRGHLGLETHRDERLIMRRACVREKIRHQAECLLMSAENMNGVMESWCEREVIRDEKKEHLRPQIKTKTKRIRVELEIGRQLRPMLEFSTTK